MMISRVRARWERTIVSWPKPANYGVALLLVAATTALIALVNSEWGFFGYVTIQNPGTVFIATVTLAAIFFGVGPALFALLLAMIAVHLFFLKHESLEREIVLIITTLIIIGLAKWQRRAQETAARAQAKFAAMLESMSDAVIVVDSAGNATDVNAAAVQQLGVADHAAGLTAVMRRRSDGTPATDEYGLLQRALKGEDTPQTDVPIPDGADGSRILSAVANPIRDPSGRIIGAVSVSRDVTERMAQMRERERLLQQIEDERRFTQQIFDSMPIGLGVYRPDDFAVLAANPIYQQFVRDSFGRELVIGTPITEYVPGFDQTEFVRQMRLALQENRAIKREGYIGKQTNAYYDWTVQPLEMGDGTRSALVTYTNVTERVRGEREREALLQRVEQEQQFTRHILDNVPVGIAVLRADDFTILSFNDEYNGSIQRAPGAQSLTVGISFLAILPPASRENATRLLSAARDERRMIRNSAYVSEVVPNAHYDGTIQPLQLADGTDALLITAVNVTERVRGEQERERLLREVERQAAQLEATFEAMVDGIAIYDAKGNVLHRNEAYYRLLDLELNIPLALGEALIEKMKMRFPDGTPMRVEDLHAYRALRGETIRGEVILRRDGRGRDRFMSQSASPIRAADGRIIGAVIAFNDITERLEHERERERLLQLVEERRQFAQTIFDTVPVGLAVIDTETLTFSTANPAFRADTKAPYRHRRLNDAPITERWPNLVESGAAERLRKIAAGGEPMTRHAARYIHPTRGETYYDEMAVPLPGTSGQGRYVLYQTMDVTEQTRAQQRIATLAREAAEHAAQLEAVFGALTEGLILADVDRNIVRSNTALARILALDDEPIPPLTEFTDRFRMYDAENNLIPREQRATSAALRGETRVDELRRFRNARGEERWMSVNTAPVRDDVGGIVGIAMTMRDVTEQRRAAEERERLLLEVEELAATAAQRAAELETIIANMPDGIVIASPQGEIVQMNATAHSILGLTIRNNAPLAEQAAFYVIRYPDGSPISPDELPIAHATRGETFTGYECVVRSGHGDIFLSCSGAPIRSETSAVTGAIVVFRDVTERKQTEELMTRLGRILDASSNEVYVYDAATLRYVQVNASAQRNLDYSMEEMTSLTTLDLKPEITAESFEQLVAPLRRRERDEVIFETVHRRKDGSTYPIEARLRLSHEENPPVFASIIQDITERYAAEQQREQFLRQIDERRRFAQAIIDSAPAGIAVCATDPDFTVRLANDRFRSIVGEAWDGPELAGVPFHAFTPNAEAAGILPIFRRVAEAGEPVSLSEFEYAGSGNTPAYYDWSLVPLQETGEGVTALLLLINDVTDRVLSRLRIEELALDVAQRASELETVIASIADGVVVVNAAGRVILENAASRELTGRAPDMEPETWLQPEWLMNADGTPMRVEEMPLVRALRGETVAEQIMLVHREDTDEDRFLMCSCAPVRATTGAITGVVAVFRDITEMKQLEQLKDDFISIAAHELRTPLTAIKGYADLLDRRLGANDSRESERKSLAVIRKQTDRLASLVNEMLDVSRIEAGRLQLNLESLDLSSLAGEVVNNLRLSSTAHMLSLVTEPDVEVLGDTTRIEQVLINLISNAITYSPEGGEVGVHVWREGDTACVSVRDHGVGIAADELPHLFDRFYRAPRAGVMRSGGMGLGLYISQEIAARHGGTIRVESVEGVGSTFTFSLPLAREGLRLHTTED